MLHFEIGSKRRRNAPMTMTKYKNVCERGERGERGRDLVLRYGVALRERREGASGV